jgi:uncharacterized membrane protein
MGEFKTYIGGVIYPLGFPVVITTVSKEDEYKRFTEFFILMIHPDGEAEYYSRRYIYNNIPESILSNEELLEGTLSVVMAKLDSTIDEKREKLGDSQKNMVPYSLRFTLDPLALPMLRFFLIHYTLKGQVEKIRQKTSCTELKSVLPVWSEKVETRWLVTKTEDF